MAFSHIYVEKRALGYPLTQKILSTFPGSKVIEIRHYKDVFNRKHQDFKVQAASRKLVLAVNDGQRIFETAPVCQDFDAERTFYSENAMNCIFDCEYCFLKGMYPGANLVVFVNLRDFEKDVDELLREGPVHINTSYETDIPAINGFTGLSDFWTDLAAKREDLTIELRTKSAPSSFAVSERIIYAFSLSPEEITERFEHGTAPLKVRLEAIKRAMQQGAAVRLCFDPVIYVSDYRECYGRFMDQVISAIDLSKVRDVSIGTFRISKDYLKQLRRNSEGSCVLYPFENREGYCVYPDEVREKMISLVKDSLLEVMDGGKIYEY